eukprot:6206636-Pleurochrysis_carterae.AAC.1
MIAQRRHIRMCTRALDSQWSWRCSGPGTHLNIRKKSRLEMLRACADAVCRGGLFIEHRRAHSERRIVIIIVIVDIIVIVTAAGGCLALKELGDGAGASFGRAVPEHGVVVVERLERKREQRRQ